MHRKLKPVRTVRDNEIDTFARWFGTLLVELRRHDLKLPRQPREHKSYARSSEMDRIVSSR